MIPPRMPPPRKSQFKRADIVAAALLLAFIFFAVSNILTNLEAAGAKPGLGFLSKEAGFDVSEALIPYSPSEPYFRVIIAGVLNTLWLSVVCILCSTVIGVLFGLLSVGPSPVGRWLARSYVDLFRNLPKILILLVLYVTAVNGLPHVRQALFIGAIPPFQSFDQLPGADLADQSYRRHPLLPHRGRDMDLSVEIFQSCETKLSALNTRPVQAGCHRHAGAGRLGNRGNAQL